MFQTRSDFQDFIGRQAFGHTTAGENRAFDEFLLAVVSFYVSPEDLVFRDSQLVYDFVEFFSGSVRAEDRAILFETKKGPVRIAFEHFVDTGYRPDAFPPIPLVRAQPLLP